MKNKNTFTYMNPKRIGLLIFIVLAAAVLWLNRKDVVLHSQNEFKLVKISTTGYELQSVIHLQNPNFLSATIKTIQEDFYINGIKVGELSSEINQGIPGWKETSFPVSIRFTSEDWERIFPDSHVPAKAEVTVKGEINFQNLTGSGKITVNIKNSLSIVN